MFEHFFDTYAIIEVVKGNKNYERFKSSDAFTSVLNLVELHYHVTRQFGLDVADELLKKWSLRVLSFSNSDIAEMTKFKISNSKKDFSLPDSLGYVLALRHGLKFLTGDEAFRNLPNVEFVK